MLIGISITFCDFISLSFRITLFFYGFFLSGNKKKFVKYLLLVFLRLCCSKNVNNSESELVLLELEVAALADVILQG